MRTKINYNFDYDHAEPSEAKVSVNSYDVFITNVSGINYNIDPKDNKQWGLYCGFCQPNPYNEYDSESIAIYDSATNRLLGYIPKNIKDEFIEWNKYRKFPFVGKIVPFINKDGYAKVYMKIHVVKPYKDNDDKTLEILEYYKERYKEEIENEINEFNQGR